MTTFTQVLSYIQNEQLSNNDLNMIIEAIKFSRSRNARSAARTLKLGEQVKFTGRRGHLVGILTEVKIKNAIVVVGSTRYKVPLAMLEAA